MDKVLHNKKVYYRKSDVLNEYKNIGIKIGAKKFNDILACKGIECKTINGFGRTLWIVESDVNRIFVDGTNISHNTKVIEKEETIQANLRLNEFFSLLSNDTLKLLPAKQREEFLEERKQNSIDEAIQKFENFEKHNNNDTSAKMREEVKKYNKYWREEGLAYRMLSLKLVNPNVIYDNDSSGLNEFVINVAIDSNGNILESGMYNGDSNYYLSEDGTLHDLYEESNINIVADRGKPFKITNEYITKLLTSCTLNNARVEDSWIYIRSAFGEIEIDDKCLLGGVVIDMSYEEEEITSKNEDIVDVDYKAV
ncbi:hypothetical protein [Clostridium baratii]|uniref:hypothetical protein n=1 Tax=Clostridium baratii TaxID=1561 RepID=UPI003D34D167